MGRTAAMEPLASAFAQPGANLVEAADHNDRVVFDLVRRSHGATRLELAGATGLTMPTMSNITGRLLRRGLIVQVGRRAARRGPPSGMFEVDPSGACFVGAAPTLAGWSCVAVDLAGSVLRRWLLGICDTPAAALARIRSALPELATCGIARERIAGIGLAPEGRDVESWRAQAGTHLSVDGDQAIPVDVQPKVGAEALQEQRFGRGLHCRRFLYLHVGTAIEWRLILDGILHDVGVEHARETRPPSLFEGVASLAALRRRFVRAGIASNLDLASADARREVGRWIEASCDVLASALGATCRLAGLEAIVLSGDAPEAVLAPLRAALARRIGLFPVVAPAREEPQTFGAAIVPMARQMLPQRLNIGVASRGDEGSRRQTADGRRVTALP